MTFLGFVIYVICSHCDYWPRVTATELCSTVGPRSAFSDYRAFQEVLLLILHSVHHLDFLQTQGCTNIVSKFITILIVKFYPLLLHRF
jgi:hypothetical protein